MPSPITFRTFQSADAEVVPVLFIDALRAVYPDIEGGEWTKDLEHIEDAYLRDGGDFLVGTDGDALTEFIARD